MRFSYAESMCDPSHYVPLARAAEAAGWSSLVVPDSLCYPETSDSRYPYTPDGDRSFLEDKPFLEPFSLIPVLAAVTTKLRFATFVLKLPVRHPLLVAKSVTSVAVLTGDRFDLGIGTSPWPEDYQLCGQEWRGRGARMDEMIAIIRGLSAGGFFGFKGRYYDLPRVKLCPVPSRPIPLLIGGHSEAALKRAARFGDGWMHAGGGDLGALLGRLGELRREHGRERLPFSVWAISLDAYHLDGVKRLEDLGVTDLIVGFRNPYVEPIDSQTLAQKLELLEGYAERVIAHA
jgi:probable F420-dependent oxidoreductase